MQLSFGRVIERELKVHRVLDTVLITSRKELRGARQQVGAECLAVSFAVYSRSHFDRPFSREYSPNPFDGIGTRDPGTTYGARARSLGHNPFLSLRHSKISTTLQTYRDVKPTLPSKGNKRIGAVFSGEWSIETKPAVIDGLKSWQRCFWFTAT